MTTHDTEALLRGAMAQELEDVMTTVDVERELATFQERQRRRDGRRRGLLAAAASVAVLAAATGGYALVSGGDDPVEEPLAARPLADGEITWVPLPGNQSPRSVDVLDGDVVVSSPTALTVLDAASAQVTGQVTAPGGFFGGSVAVTADGQTWTPYEDDQGRGYARVDRDGGGVQAVSRLGVAYTVAAGGAGLWAVPTGDAVAELDPVTGAVRRTVALPFRPFGLAVTDDAVWAQEARGGALARVDARTGQVEPGPDLQGSAPMALLDGSLWVGEPETASVVQVDAGSGEVVRRVALPGSDPTPESQAALWVAAADGSVYVASRAGSHELLTRIDATDGSVVDVVDLGPGRSTVLGAGGGGVWVAERTSQVGRFDPPERE